MGWALGVTTMLGILLLYAISKTIGWEFYVQAGAAWWNYAWGFTDVAPAFPVWPYPALFAAFLTSNKIVQLLVVVLMSLWWFGWSGTVFLSSTRVIFAAAFDRLLPEKVAEVNERTGTPVNALLMMVVPSVLVAYLFAYNIWGFQSLTLCSTLVIAVTYLGTTISAIVLPYTKPELYKSSPIAKYNVLGIQRIEVGGLLDRVEPYTPETIPDDVVLIIGGADVQKDRIEAEWIGVGNEEETWGIEVVKVFGDTEKPETWQRLSNAIERTFKRQDGTELRPAALAIDIHFRPKSAREWCSKHGTRALVFPIIGVASSQGTLVRDHWNKTYGQRTFSIHTDAAKDIIFGRLMLDTPGRRYYHFPRSYPDEWFRQLTCEKAVTRYTRGFPKRIYEKPSGARNEAIDMRVYWLWHVSTS